MNAPRGAWLGLALAATLAGQGLDSVPPVVKWLDGGGEPVAEDSAVVVYLGYPGVAAAGLAGDADHLSMLQRRIANRGGVVVVLVDEAAVPAVRHLRPARLGLSAPAALLGWSRRLLDRDGCAAVVFDRTGTQVHVGSPSGALDDAVERVLAGALDPAAEKRNTLMALSLGAQLWTGSSGMRQTAAQLLQWSPRDGVLHALRYLAVLEKEFDTAAAAVAMQASVDALANEPRAMADFAAFVLRGTPSRGDIAQKLVAALAGATAAAPNDTVVQLALLRALVARGAGRAVEAQAARVRPLAFATAHGALEFAEILVHADDAPTHRALCEAALARAEELGSEAPWRDAVRYEVLVRAAADGPAAAALLAEAVATLGTRTAVNNRCWYLMTAHEQMGRGNVFAAALADWLLQAPERADSAELDTIALAMYVAGRFPEAVQYETAALRRGPDRDYQHRLARYEAARQRRPQ